jgi:glycosyltransferase involved in cell wall biosynthesis
MRDKAEPRIAWLFPIAYRSANWRGAYWQPLFGEFVRHFPDTTVFSGLRVGELGPRLAARARYLTFWNKNNRPRLIAILLLLPIIIYMTVGLKPDLVFASGFGECSILSILMKLLRPVRVVVVYDGSSPAVDARRSRFRLLIRRLVARLSDGFITNSSGGKRYLVDVLKAREGTVFSRPYLVPDISFLSAGDGPGPRRLTDMKRPVFLYVGRVTVHKGLPVLLSACAALKGRSRKEYSLLIVGDGPERAAFESQARRLGLESVVRFAGWVEYGLLGGYLKSSDVVVFPTLADVWGATVLEAMAFARPVICSLRAGASELVVHGENGFVFDPGRPEVLADLMARFIDDPSLASRMGRRARELTAGLNPRSAAEGLAEVVRRVLALRHPGGRSRSRPGQGPARGD